MSLRATSLRSLTVLLLLALASCSDAGSAPPGQPLPDAGSSGDSSTPMPDASVPEASLPDAADAADATGCEPECQYFNASECTAGSLRTCSHDAEGCLVWSSPQNCASGLCKDSTSCSTCNNTCAVAGKTECSAGKLTTCVGDSEGCLAWSEPTSCSSGFCADAFSCGACQNACSAAGKTECSSGQVKTCQADANGCLSFSAATACTSGFCADASSCGNCSNSCPAAGQTECSLGKVKTCQADAKGCLSWSTPLDCPSGFCAASGASCGSCSNSCTTAGLTECAAGKLRTCQADSNGCLSWSAYQACSSGFCGNTVSCGSCNNQCLTPGAVECAQGQTRSCQADANGCLSWSAWAACSSGVCADADKCCVPTTCAALQKNCGSLSDGCGKTLNCGSCSYPQTCGGSGTQNVCGCTPETDPEYCSKNGKSCGSVVGTDQCGKPRTFNCGGCPSGFSCGTAGSVANSCVPNVTLPSLGVCTTNGFCVQTPTPINVILRAVQRLPSGEIWAVGDSGTVLKIVGGSVQGWYGLRDVNFTSVWASGANDIWVGGDKGLVLRFNGTTWLEQPLPLASTRAADIWGSAATEVWVASGHIWRWNGSQYTQTTTGTSQDDFSQITGLGPNQPFALQYSYLWSWNGSSWSNTNATGSRFAPGLSGEIWLSSDTACSSTSSNCYEPVLKKYLAGQTYNVILPSGFTTNSWVRPITQSSLTEAWLLRSTQGGYTFDGQTWSSVGISSEPPAFFTDAASPSATPTFVGSKGTVYVRESGSWKRQIAQNFPENIVRLHAGDTWMSGTSRRVAPLSASLVLTAFSSYAQVYGESSQHAMGFWNGSAWTGMKTTWSAVTAVGSGDGTTAWALQDTGSGQSQLHYWDGASWSDKGSLPGSYSLIRGTSASDLWAFGTGAIAHYNGTAWSSSTHPLAGTTDSFKTAAVASPNVAFALSYSKTLLSWNGSSWSLATAPASDVQLLWAEPGKTDVYAVGLTAVYRFAAGSWSKLNLPTSSAQLLPQAWGASDAQLSFAYDNGVVWSYNGSQWSSAQWPAIFLTEYSIVQRGTSLIAHGGDYFSILKKP